MSKTNPHFWIYNCCAVYTESGVGGKWIYISCWDRWGCYLRCDCCLIPCWKTHELNDFINNSPWNVVRLKTQYISASSSSQEWMEAYPAGLSADRMQQAHDQSSEACVQRERLWGFFPPSILLAAVFCFICKLQIYKLYVPAAVPAKLPSSYIPARRLQMNPQNEHKSTW